MQTNEDTSLPVTLAGTDADNNTLTYSIVTGPSHGTLSGTETSRTYTPAANYYGSDSFTFKVNDGRLDSAPANVSITVTGINDAPVAIAQSVSTDEDTSKSGTLTGTDIDSSELTFALGTQAIHGIVTVQSNGSYNYTPAANYNGPDAFTFTSNDGSLTSQAATVSITVNAVNDVPVATAQSVTTEEDTSVEIVLAGTDVDSDPLTYTPGSVNHGSLAQKAGTSNTYIFTPAANYNGPAAFNFTVNDGTLTSTPATVSITVDAVNDAPVAAAQAISTDEDTQKTGTLTGSDIEGSNLTFTVAADAEHGTVTLETNGAFSYTPDANYNGSDSFTFTVHDGNLASLSATVTITVNAVNDAPVASNDTGTVNEDGILMGGAILVNDSDVDNAELTAELVNSPTKGTLELLPNGTYTYTPNPNYNGSDSFTYRATDGSLSSNLATVSITVQAVNDAPIATAQSVTTDEDVAIEIELTGTDVDGDALSYTPGSVGYGMLTLKSGNTYIYAPAANYNGSDLFTFKVNDGSVDSAPATVSITVDAVNDAPVVAQAISDVSVLEDATNTELDLSNTFADVDIATNSDALALTVSGNTNPALVTASYNAATKKLILAYGTNQSGTATIKVKATDNVSAAVEDEFVVTVAPVNDAPSFVKGYDQEVDEDASAQSVSNWATNVSAGADNESTQELTFIVTNNNTTLFATQPVIDATGKLTYTPAVNANGIATVSVQLQDNGGTADEGIDESSVETFTITINAVNDAPSFAKGADQTVLEDAGTQTISGWATGISTGPSDEAGQILAFSATTTNNDLFSSLPSIAADGTLTYTPAANAYGSATVSVTLKDNGGIVKGGVDESATQEFTITVNSVNDEPAGTDNTLTTQEDTSYPFAAADFGFSDTDGNSLAAVKITTLPTAGRLQLSGSSVVAGQLIPAASLANLSFSPALNANGTGYASFTFQVQDNGGTSNGGLDLDQSPNTITLDVTPVNDAPIATAQSVTTEEDVAKLITLTGTDIEGDALTYSIVANPAHGSVSGSGHTFTYTPNADYYGSDSFTFQANDGALDSEPATVSITVTPVNDAPTLAAISAPEAINEDASEQTMLLSGISSGAANEVQTLTVTATSNNTSLVDDIAVLYTSQETSGSLKYTPKANQYGSALITVKVNDGDLEVTKTFTITVNSVNDAPSFTKGADQTVLEDAGAQTVSGWATAISAGPANESTQQVAFQIISNSASALFTADGQPAINAAGQLTYTPAANANGTATIHVKLTDNGGTDNSGVAESAEQIFVINITAVNDAPVAANDAGTVNEDAALYGGSVLTNDTDVDDATLTAVLVTGPAHGSLTLSPDGSYTYTPAANYNGPDSFIYKAQDAAHEGSNPATVALTVTAVNDAPVADAMTISTNEDTEKTGTLTGSDIEGSPLTFALATAAAHGTATIQGNGSFSYQPAANYNGPDSFTFTVQDGALTSAVATVSVTVNAVNDAPTLAAVSTPAAINEDAAEQTVSLSGISTGAANEAQTLTVTATSSNTALLDNPTVVYTSPQGTGTLKYTPKANQFGSASVTVKVSDGDAETTQSFTVMINPVNDAPSFVKGSDQVVNEDAAAQTITGWATALSTGPANEGTQSLSFVVSNSNTGLFAAQPAVDATGKLTFTPAANANGVAIVSVNIKDDGGTTAGGIAESAVQTFTITVNAVNDAPTFTAGANQTVQEDAPAQSVAWATYISAGPANEATQTVSFVVSNNNTSLFTSTGQPAIDATGKLSYALAPNANGAATVSVKLQDNGGVVNGGVDASAIQTFTINVAPVNDLPVITSITAPAAPMAINTAVNVSAVFTDVDAFAAGNYTATWTWDDGRTSTGTVSSANGVLTVNGSYTYNTPGVYNLTLSLADNGGSTATASATSPLQAVPLTYQYVVIYDPNGGFVTGGGWIWSPKGALRSNPAAEGKANFGFVAKYKKGSTTVVEGSTEFQFKAGDINFNSTSYEAARLVISGSKASYKGEGTINGTGRYGFMTSAVDGQYNDGTGADRFRIKIWNINAGGAIVYDNLLDNAADNYDLNAAPTTIIQGGSIVIHNPDVKTSTKTSTLTTTDGPVPAATVKATFSNYPNPFSEKTTLTFALDKNDSYELTLYDAKGMLMKRIQAGTAEAGRVYSFELSGRDLAEGIYFARLVTSSKVQTMRIAVRK